MQADLQTRQMLKHAKSSRQSEPSPRDVVAPRPSAAAAALLDPELPRITPPCCAVLCRAVVIFSSSVQEPSPQAHSCDFSLLPPSRSLSAPSPTVLLLPGQAKGTAFWQAAYLPGPAAAVFMKGAS